MTTFHMMERQDISFTRVPIMTAPQSSLSSFRTSFRSEGQHERNELASHADLSQNTMIADHYVQSFPNTVGYHHSLSSNIYPSSSILFNTQNLIHRSLLSETCVLPQPENLSYFHSNHSNVQSMGNGYMSCQEVPMQMQTPRQQMFRQSFASQTFANSRQDISLSMGFTYPSNSMNSEEMYHVNRQMDLRLKMQRPQMYPRGM